MSDAYSDPIIPYLAGLLHGQLLPEKSFFCRSYPQAEIRPAPPDSFVISLHKGEEYRVTVAKVKEPKK